MNKIDKFLSKLDARRRRHVEEAMADVASNQLTQYHIKKLAKRENEYRIRVGAVRIQFAKTAMGNVITRVGFRNERTYE